VTAFKLGVVVEGQADVRAVPILLRRIAREIDPNAWLEVIHPIRAARSSLVNKPGELERAVGLAALRARPHGGVLVLIDGDDDCLAELGPQLLNRAEKAAMGLPVSVVLARREFESWFLAAAVSLRGKRGLPPDLVAPPNTEEIRGAKEWLRRKKQAPYSENIDQPAFTAVFDLEQARTNSSFDKCCREVRRFMERS